MRYQPPNRLHWVQVRDALAAPSGWRWGRLVEIDGELATVVPTVPTAPVESATPSGSAPVGAGPPAETVGLTCVQGPELALAALDGVTHPDGGTVVLWSVPGRVLALPLAGRCTVDVATIALDDRAVIAEERRRFEVLAEDSTWACRLFLAVDRAARAAAREEARARAEARPDRSTLFPKLRSSLLPERPVRPGRS